MSAETALMPIPGVNEPVPTRNDEYLLYQTLVGAWPIDRERLTEYMLKAAHEAKVHTSWIEPDADYERGLTAFIAGVIGDAEFTADLEAFLAPLLWPARVSGGI